MPKRLHVIVSGRVQGVCFRAWTRKTALALSLTGWVRNLPCGNVEAVFEGEEAPLATMKARCSEGPALARVDRVAADEAPGSGEWDTFTIRYD